MGDLLAGGNLTKYYMYYLFSYKKLLCNPIYDFSSPNSWWHLSTPIRVAKVCYCLLYNPVFAVILLIFKSMASKHKEAISSCC